ncbi:MAG: GTPase ObgE [Proteobacteria bacterium]|nr:GTPase ObgE [Pseudomonadota bacterium]
MQFIDEVKIFVKSGDGGDGCTAFRREANLPRGGPNGGNGGRGGSVIIECISGLNTLIDYRYKQHFKAKKGGNGMGSDRHGAFAEDLIIQVPMGTQVFEEDGETLIMDIKRPGQRFVLAKGGDGGYGNMHFKTSTNRAPRKHTKGWPGTEQWVWLRLKLLSDAGLVGMPNAGKSTFLAAVSAAKPKIADYPFTTLKPQLGVVNVTEGNSFVLADIPGLIEGASEGHGLGHQFLKHVERCGILLHLIDGTADDVALNYKTIRKELKAYSEVLAGKEEIVALNKCDSLSEEEIALKKKALEKASKKEVKTISGATGEGVRGILYTMNDAVKAFRAAEAEAEAAAEEAEESEEQAQEITEYYGEEE